ncbi:MAG: PD40 domain-containing protein [Phycisphaerae bacterium]|nr:PD40 domain-containing protein [Phycisphaerae bacterium]
MSSRLTGKIVFASGKHGDYDIWALDLDGKRLKQLTSGKFWNDKPRWSPDGKWVVFVSNAAGTPGIYKMPADGGQAVPLICDGRWNDFPAFSPDGTRLGYVSNVSGNNDLFIADVDGCDPRQITTYEGDDSSFAWMPDGKSVLFSSDRSGNADVWRLDLRTGDKQQLTTDPGMDIAPAPSPDGKYVAFVSNRQFDPESCRTEWSDRDLDVWMMTIGGKHKVRLTDNQGSDRCVAWSPNGRHLVYAASKSSDAAERLRIVDVTSLLDAYRSDDEETIQRAADKLRKTSLDFDRRDLEAEIDARRHTFLLTSFLPDFIVRPLYGDAYFGSERYPDWVATPRPKHIQTWEEAVDSVG